jgi:hypothetical protein
MPKINNDGTDQYVLFRASKSDYSGALTGTLEGDSLAGAVVVWSEYKKADVSISSPSVTWNSTAGMWKAVIPAGNVTQNGHALLNVSGTGMIPVAIEVDVGNSGGSGGMGHIITGYTFDASEKTITITEAGYTTLKLEQILEIRNISKGKLLIYDSKIRAPSITVTGAVISWTGNYSYEGKQFEDTDSLQIIVNTS